MHYCAGNEIDRYYQGLLRGITTSPQAMCPCENDNWPTRQDCSECDNITHILRLGASTISPTSLHRPDTNLIAADLFFFYKYLLVFYVIDNLLVRANYSSEPCLTIARSCLVSTLKWKRFTDAFHTGCIPPSLPNSQAPVAIFHPHCLYNFWQASLVNTHMLRTILLVTKW